MPIIEGIQPPYVKKKTNRTKADDGKKMREFQIEISTLSTSVVRNEYKQAYDGWEPMIYMLHVVAATPDGMRVYFRHNLYFKRFQTIAGNRDVFDRDETDFVRITYSFSFDPEKMPGNPYNQIDHKIRIGDKIRVTGLPQNELSRSGNEYLTLTRVTIPKQETFL